MPFHARCTKDGKHVKVFDGFGSRMAQCMAWTAPHPCEWSPGYESSFGRLTMEFVFT